MKSIRLKCSKKTRKLEEKVFTKKKGKDTIKKKYNPLSKDYNSYERGGLYMEETKIILEELKKHLNWNLKIFVNIFPKTCMKLYRKGMADCYNYYNKDGTF